MKNKIVNLMKTNENVNNSEEYYQDKFVYVFEFESLQITSVLHTVYPKFIYDLESKKIEWLEKFKNDLSKDEVCDMQLELFEKVQEFITQNKIQILIENDTIDTIK